ncbi:hypothetical protein [Hyphomicrobium sp. CS1GBMeth3]|uniref:hypothetical protein n=1 Tax=Hyphomicrobium sp. CS1GBMeth3 TaxID=1892845 RepID=UPI0009319E91|nr:hypothetical protein [Hyphomicrobium sp. CS1GBMeth3]
MLTLPPEVIALVESGRFAIRHLLRVDLDGGSEGLWNGSYPLIVSDVTYAPLAGNMVVEEVPGSVNLDAERVQVRVSGLSPAVTGVLDGVAWHQRPTVLSVAFMNEAGSAVHVLPRFSGFLDHLTISDVADGVCEIVVEVESNNRGLYRSSTRVRSDNDQRRVSATDGFFKYATAAAIDVQIPWGRKGEQYPVRPK